MIGSTGCVDPTENNDYHVRIACCAAQETLAAIVIQGRQIIDFPKPSASQFMSHTVAKTPHSNKNSILVKP